MFPVLFTIGKIHISSYGVFLALGFLVGVFLIWRLCRAWDLDEEKILDLTLFTFLGGLLGARIYFCLEHFQLFSENILAILLFNKVPGFSFWGAFLGGWLTLYYFAKRKTEDFWQLGDIASVGLLGGLIFTNLGCFLGGCSIGIQSKLFFSVNMVGSLGRRFPTQALEAFLLFLILLGIWSSATHFHQRGKILSLSLIYIGVIKLVLEPLREIRSENVFLSVVLLILGITIFYKVTKRNLISDLKGFGIYIYNFLTDAQSRKMSLAQLGRNWYNQKTSLAWKFKSLKRNLNLKKSLRRFNVRF